MSWSSGASLLRNIWGDIRTYIPHSKSKVLVQLMDRFAGEDCDDFYDIINKDWPETRSLDDQNLR